jgi:(p)ppGpp synthase/HD superfamily hydrolase
MAYGERFEEALVYAARIHRDQVRKATGIPYITHLLAVAALVGENGGGEDAVIAALLHDAIEDQGGPARLRDIRERFGPTVARIVADCSDTDTIPKPPWRARKEAYLRTAGDKPLDSQLVSLADKVHNARATLADLRAHGDVVWERFRGGREGTLWYNHELLAIYRRTGVVPPLVAEFARVVAEIEQLDGAGDPSAGT